LKVIIKENAMPGTVAGGRKAADTNRKRYGKTFYVRIGALGGKKSTGGGFAANPELAREAGRKGGQARKKKQA
jgi:general stress protein YciG